MEFLTNLAGFFPSGPLTTLYAIVLLAVTVPCMRWGKNRTNDVAVVLFCSWPMALVATKLDSSLFQAIGTIALCGFLAAIGTRLAILVIVLAALKLIVYSANVGGLINWEQMWAFSEVFAYLQLIVLFGGTINGRTVGLYFSPSDSRRGFVSSGVLQPAKRRAVARSGNDLGGVDRGRRNIV